MRKIAASGVLAFRSLRPCWTAI